MGCCSQDFKAQTGELMVAGQLIGPGRPPFIVAEIGGNHGGDEALAERMIQAAADSGASAVKFQAYRTSEFLSRLSPYYKELVSEELDFDSLGRLVARAHELGLGAGLTVFDRDGLELALDCEADFIKISSGDLTNYPLLALAAGVPKPLFLSTGASWESEVRAALAVCVPAARRLVVLHCCSLYPAPEEAANLAVMDRWLHSGLAAGYSDHCLGIGAARGAAALGAWVLEKHFTIDSTLPGGDNSISIGPEELRRLVGWAADVDKRGGEARQASSRPWWGQAEKKPHLLEVPVRLAIRRAVVASRDLPEGQVLGFNDLALRRPPPSLNFFGPQDYGRLPGRILRRPLAEGAPLMESDLYDG